MNMEKSISYKAFEMMLGISEPLYIERIEMESKKREMHIHVNFRRGAKFVCPKCGKEGNSVANTTDKVWRTLDMHHYKTFIYFRNPYVKCDSGECGTPLWTPSWSKPGSSFTYYFEAFVLQLVVSGMNVSSISSLLDEHDTRLWRLINRYSEEEYSKMDYSAVSRVAFDETSRKKGHTYFSIATDLDSHKVIAVLDGKGADTLKDFASEMTKHNLDVSEKVKELSIDMSKPFISGAKSYLPNASITFDKFHLIKPLHAALDNIRRCEQSKGDGLFRKRWCLMKNPNNLTEKEKIALVEIKKQYPKLGRAYRIVQAFKDIFSCNLTITEGIIKLKSWLSWAVRSRLEPIKKFALLVKKHWDGIIHYFESRVTNGIAEGINSVIQNIKRAARGFRNPRNFRSIIYLRCGRLPLPLLQ